MPTRLDARHSIAPLTLLRIGSAMQELRAGETIEVLCDEPALADDLKRVFRDWTCERVTGTRAQNDGCCVFRLRRIPRT